LRRRDGEDAGATVAPSAGSDAGAGNGDADDASVCASAGGSDNPDGEPGNQGLRYAYLGELKQDVQIVNAGESRLELSEQGQWIPNNSGWDTYKPPSENSAAASAGGYWSKGRGAGKSSKLRERALQDAREREGLPREKSCPEKCSDSCSVM